MAVPSISTYLISNGSHRYGSIGGAAVMTTPSDAVTKVSAIISQTSGGAAIETVETTVKVSSDQFADRWALDWHTTGITSSPYYVLMWATNADGDGPTREVAPYIYLPPTISITTPANGSTVTSAAVTMAWTVSADDGVSWQRVTVAQGGTVLCSEELDGTARQLAVPSSVVFETGKSYTFTVEARSVHGIDGSATSTASFSYTAPKDASLSIATGTALSADITVTFGSGSPATTSVDVMRVNDDGTLHPIAEGVADGATVNDPLPPLGTAFQYVTVSHASGNRISKKAHDAMIATSAWALNYGDGASEGIELRYNPQASYSMSHGGDLYHFADGGTGNGLPVFYSTTDRDESGTLKFDTIMNADADALRAAVMAHPVMWLRDPFGHRWRAHVTLSYTHGTGQLWPVTLAWDAVRFEEA